MRTPITSFVSFAHKNFQRADEFLKRLSEQLAPSKHYEYAWWRDTAIPVGELWEQEIQRAIAECDLGLLLVSPAFLGSKYITCKELPRFVGTDAKAVIPVMLEGVNFARHDLKGLQDLQIFGLAGRDKPRVYSECRGDCSRRDFVERLFLEIESRLDILFGVQSP